MNIIRRIRNRIKYEREINPIKKGFKDIMKMFSEKGVKLLYVELPVKEKLIGLTPFENDRINNWCFDFNRYKEEIQKLRILYGEDVTSEYILSVFDGGVVVQGEKRKILLDFESEHQHIVNGRRITIGQPNLYHNTIYTHGACTWRGTGVEDRETIASYLQDSINNIMPNNYRVINSGIGRGSSIFDDFQLMMEQQYNPGDIVIVGSFGGLIGSLQRKFFNSIGAEFIETSSLFARPHNFGEWFNDDPLHTNKRGNKVISDCIFKFLFDNSWLISKDVTEVTMRKPPMPKDKSSLVKGEKIYGDNPALLKYIDSLKVYKKGTDKSLNGSIVMNCNPFTLGHRYLIEYAASKVDNLYIFVVEENRSYFTFEDRFELVKKGTADIKNVTVLPSGNFIISATTFPGYFYKDNLKEAKIDCSNDISVFAQYIAPTLNIKIRFAGEEPLDPVTNQYNEGMKEILPQYGMVFKSIPRKKDKDGDGVISASRVRKYFENGEMEQIKKIVPESTYLYLLNRCNKEKNEH